MSAILGWTLPVTVLAICVPMIVYTTIGGVQAVAWTDVKQMFIVVGGMSAAVVDPAATASCSTSASARRCTWPARPAGCKAIDFTFDLRETYTFWSGMIGGLFLMLSYFGCDQSQVQRYLTAKSIDEARQSLLMSALRQDPAAAADSGERRAGVRLLSVPDAADAVQPRLRRAGRGRARTAAEYAALEQEFDAAIAVRRDARPSATIATAFLASDARVRDIRAQAVGDRQAGDRRRALQRRQLRVSDLHHDAHADRPGRADDRGDLRGGDVGQRRRAERARHGDDHRLLPAAFRHAGVATRTT